MFTATCETCGREVLLTSRRIELLRNTEHGIVVVFRCWKGHLGTLVTGRDAAPARSAGTPSPAAA